MILKYNKPEERIGDGIFHPKNSFAVDLVFPDNQILPEFRIETHDVVFLTT